MLSCWFLLVYGATEAEIANALRRLLWFCSVRPMHCVQLLADEGRREAVSTRLEACKPGLLEYLAAPLAACSLPVYSEICDARF